MTRALVLDSEAFLVLTGSQSQRRRRARSAVDAARRLNQRVTIPAVVLAELYREPQPNQRVDSFLSRERGITIRDTDPDFARYVGGVLASAGAGSEDMADAHLVAAAVEAGGGVVLTTDDQDLNRLAASYPTVVVERLP